MAAVSSNLVLIGSARDNTAAASAGAAYLCNINGSLLMTFTNTAPTYYDYFGWSVAAVDPARILVGARYADIGANDSGAAYLFAAAPHLDISQTPTNTLRIAWSSGWPGWVLQRNDDLSSTNWIVSSEPVSDGGIDNSVIVIPTAGKRHYRLIQL